MTPSATSYVLYLYIHKGKPSNYTCIPTPRVRAQTKFTWQSFESDRGGGGSLPWEGGDPHTAPRDFFFRLCERRLCGWKVEGWAAKRCFFGWPPPHSRGWSWKFVTGFLSKKKKKYYIKEIQRWLVLFVWPLTRNISVSFGASLSLGSSFFSQDEKENPPLKQSGGDDGVEENFVQGKENYIPAIMMCRGKNKKLAIK